MQWRIRNGVACGAWKVRATAVIHPPRLISYSICLTKQPHNSKTWCNVASTPDPANISLCHCTFACMLVLCLMCLRLWFARMLVLKALITRRTKRTATIGRMACVTAAASHSHLDCCGPKLSPQWHVLLLRPLVAATMARVTAAARQSQSLPFFQNAPNLNLSCILSAVPWLKQSRLVVCFLFWEASSVNRWQLN